MDTYTTVIVLIIAALGLWAVWGQVMQERDEKRVADAEARRAAMLRHPSNFRA